MLFDGFNMQSFPRKVTPWRTLKNQWLGSDCVKDLRIQVSIIVRQIRQLLGLMLIHQRLDDVLKVPLHDIVELV